MTTAKVYKKENPDVSKRINSFLVANKQVLSSEVFSIDEALKVIELYAANFATKAVESVDLSFGLGIDPKKSDQVIKGTCNLKHPNGKKVVLLAFAEGAQVEELKNLGVKYVGSEDLVADIIAGNLVPGRDFTSCIATQDVMTKIAKSKAVQILGKAGVMPNLKLGTVSNDIILVAKNVMGGRVELRSDKFGFIKLSIGRINYSSSQLKENLIAVYQQLKNLKPVSVKGNFFVTVKLSATMMGVSLNIKLSDLYAS